MSKKRRTSAFHGRALRLKALAKGKDKYAATAKKLSRKAKQIVVTARKNEAEVVLKEKESIRRKLVVTAEKLHLKARQLAVLAKGKESVRRKLVVTAKEKESIRRKLVVTAKEKEDVRRKLVVTAKKLKMSHATLGKKVLERTKDLELLRAKDEAILASIGDGLVATDKNKRILLVNKAFERLLGWKGGEAQGKYLSEVIPMVDSNGNAIAESERLLTMAIQKRSTATTTITTMYYKRKDGTYFPVAITVAPIFTGNKLMGAVEVFRDITKEKEIEKAKSEFMTIASHQLRTPLTAIRWALSSLKRENLPEEQRTLVQTAHETSTHMAVTIRRMLMISRLEEGGTDPDIAEVDLPKVLEKIARLHDTHRQRNGLELVIRCPQHLRVRTDEQLLIEILDNFLSNAYKYTPKGGKVSVEAMKEGEKIRIDVADTGYGIPLAEQKRIPEKFFRASNIASPVEAGTGIGLYMVYNIVRLIGGTISFVSEENKGTTFTLLLPSHPL